MKIRNNCRFVIAGLFIFALLIPLSQVSANPPDKINYCQSPPFLVARTQPNVMIVLDNSGSMEGAAYLGTFDPTQFNTGHYYGYFDPTKNYKYTTSSTPSRWVPTTDDIATGTATNPIISGEVLNWATMKRVDISKKLLIGGKASSEDYAAADRDTAPVKIYGHDEGNFNKDYVSPTSAPYTAYPFAGDYNYDVSDRSLEISPNVTGSSNEIRRPTSDISDGAWVISSGSDSYDMVDDTGNGDSDTTYLKNTSTANNDQAIFGYDRSAFSIAGSIANVTINVRAKRVGSSSRRLSAVLRMKSGLLTTQDYISSYQTPGTSYSLYSFGWNTNPQTGAAWTFADLTDIATGSLTGFGIETSTTPSSTKYLRVTQVYMTVTVSNPSGTYNIIIDQGSTPARGILDGLASDVRFGLTYYNGSTDGGHIPVHIGFDQVPSMITSISDLNPDSYTPLAETLRTVVSYFRQEAEPYGHTTDATGYYRGDLANDPYYYASPTNQYVPCTNSFVLYLTDGESTKDENMPGGSGSCSVTGESCTSVSDCRKVCSGGAHATCSYNSDCGSSQTCARANQSCVFTPAACSSTNLQGCSGRICDKDGVCETKDPRFAGTAVGAVYDLDGTDYMIDVAYWGRTGDARPGSCLTKPIDWSETDHCLPKVQNIYTYPVFLFGSGSTLLKDVSIYGGFNDINENGRPDCDTLQEECYRDSDGDGTVESNGDDEPLTYYEGDDGYKLEANITAALTEILRRTASGTAASVLASGEGSGANLLQSIFYPRRSISGQPEITWTSTLLNLWYHLDIASTNSTIRENSTDTDTNNGVMELNLDTDNIIGFFFDSASQKAKAKLYADANADGIADSATPVDTVDGSDLKNLWEAGLILWNTSAGARNIYTNVTDTPAATTAAFAGMTAFTTANLTGTTPTLQSLLNTDYTVGTGANQRTAANNTTVAQNIINYIRGTDFAPVTLATPTETLYYRSRTTAIDLSDPKNDTVTDTLTIKGDSWSEAAKVWKLGDIVNSTPRIVAWIPLNTYHTTYNDSTYNTFINSSTYKGRNMVFAGANDGMLHAFKLGTLDLTISGNKKAELCQDDNSNSKCEATEKTKTNLGKERWAFIPKGVLPYLQYLADPNYCHLYYVDATPYVFDASIEQPGSHSSDYWTQTRQTKCGSNQTCTDVNNTLDMTHTSWRTVLIGSMRLGGACRDAASTYGVQTPAAGKGYSTYFALDITNPESPQFLWEFSNANLGFASSGPTIVKISARNSSGSGPTDTSDADKTKNGKWFVVFASGPTGPVGTSQNKGFSDQNLRLFVLDLKTGTLLHTIDTGIANAFGGSLNNATFDYDFDGQDDALYLGYTKAEDGTLADNIWNKGGVLRVITREDLKGHDVSTTATAAGNGTALNPANWLWSKVVDNIGPVNASVGHLAHYPIFGKIPDKAYLFFGSGRYFHPSDDASTQQRMYGVVEPCLDKIKDITTDPALSPLHSTVCDDNSHGAAPACADADTLPAKDIIDSASCLKNATTTVPAAAKNGWYLDLDTSAGTAYSERMITDPLAAQNGAVFFTTFAPDSDICSYGGKTYLWAVKYDTAAAVGSSLSGIGLLQVSTGAIEQVTLHSRFGETTDASHKYGRRTDAIDGVPPTGQGLSLVTPPNPINKMLHIKKR